ncbi:FecR domain-containing protein [Verrucomicrobiota bacterium]
MPPRDVGVLPEETIEMQGPEENDQGSTLLDTLARLEKDPALDEADAVHLAERLRLDEGLRPLTRDDADRHLELPALRKLADKCRAGGMADMPAHLAACPICLDLFQCFLAGVPAVSDSTIARFENLAETPDRRSSIVWFPSARILLRAAAAVALLLGAGVLLKPLVFPGPPVTTQGVFTLANGAAVAEGERVPARQPFTMSKGAELALDDGATSVRAEAESRMSFSRSLRGDPTFVVNDGDVRVTAAKQKRGSSIMVRTPLGDIRVIGTEFRVTLKREQVVVYENQPKQAEIEEHVGEISAVIVAVREGVVSLRNRHEEVAVSAGHTAVIRQGQPRIELRGE